MIVPDAEVIGHRYATRSQTGEKVGHLLTRTWSEDRRGLRPALCGLKRQRWRAVELFTNAGEFRDCIDCSIAAGLVQREPVALVPAPRPRPHRTHPYDVVTVRGQLLDPQHARAAMPERHRVYRGRNPFGLSYAPGVEDYVQPVALSRATDYRAGFGRIAFPSWAPLTSCTTP